MKPRRLIIRLLSCAIIFVNADEICPNRQALHTITALNGKPMKWCAQVGTPSKCGTTYLPAKKRRNSAGYVWANMRCQWSNVLNRCEVGPSCELKYLGCYDFEGENPLKDKTVRQCEGAAFSFATPRLFFGLQSQGGSTANSANCYTFATDPSLNRVTDSACATQNTQAMSMGGLRQLALYKIVPPGADSTTTENIITTETTTQSTPPVTTTTSTSIETTSTTTTKATTSSTLASTTTPTTTTTVDTVAPTSASTSTSAPSFTTSTTTDTTTTITSTTNSITAIVTMTTTTITTSTTTTTTSLEVKSNANKKMVSIASVAASQSTTTIPLVTASTAAIDTVQSDISAAEAHSVEDSIPDSSWMWPVILSAATAVVLILIILVVLKVSCKRSGLSNNKDGQTIPMPSHNKQESLDSDPPSAVLDLYVANGVPRPYNEDATYYHIRRGSLYSRNDYASSSTRTSTDGEFRTHKRTVTILINQNEYFDQAD